MNIRRFRALRSNKEDSEPEKGFSVDFDELKGINPDTVGWIRFYPEPSIINYPIVQTTDNEKYLTQNIFRKMIIHLERFF